MGGVGVGGRRGFGRLVGSAREDWLRGLDGGSWTGELGGMMLRRAVLVDMFACRDSSRNRDGFRILIYRVIEAMLADSLPYVKLPRNPSRPQIPRHDSAASNQTSRQASPFSAPPSTKYTSYPHSSESCPRP